MKKKKIVITFHQKIYEFLTHMKIYMQNNNKFDLNFFNFFTLFLTQQPEGQRKNLQKNNNTISVYHTRSQ